MRTMQLTVTAAAALATFVAGSTLAAQPRRTPSTAPLSPLSEDDLLSNRHGCECIFGNGRADLLRIIDDELTIRTHAGRQFCTIRADQFSALSNGRGQAVCAGVRLSLRPTGRVRVNAETDSSEGPAALTVAQGRTRRTVAGTWNCVC